MAKPNQLHFFPGPHLVIWVVDGKPALTVDAWGGEPPTPGFDYGVMKPRRTTPGRYVIYSYAPYRTRTWELSRIAWGTPLQIDPATGEVMYETGLANRRWRKVTDLIPGATMRELRARYYELYGESRKYDPDHDYIPDRWVFNDFGAFAVRYFVDKNHDGKLNAGENLSGEMIHTTPDDEAHVALGQNVQLVSSHGCIHINPAERDKLRSAGAFERGTPLVIHPYEEQVPASF